MATFTTTAAQDQIVLATFNRLKESGSTEAPTAKAWFEGVVFAAIASYQTESLQERGRKVIEAVKADPSKISAVETAAGL